MFMARDKNKEGIVDFLLTEHETGERTVLYILSFFLILYCVVFKEVLGKIIITGDVIEDGVGLFLIAGFSLLFAWPLSGIIHLILMFVRLTILKIISLKKR